MRSLLVPVALGLAVLAVPARAAADSISSALSGETHAGPGELSVGEGAVLSVLWLGALIIPAVTIAHVSHDPPREISRGVATGLTVGGSAIGVATAAFVPSRRSDMALMMYSVTSGFSLAVAGAGVGGLVRPSNWRAALLGPSAGYVLGATTTALMALSRDRSSPGLGATATVLGAIGTLGCFGIAAGGFQRGVEGYGGVGVACTTLGTLSFLVGVVYALAPSSPTPARSMAAVPWTVHPWATLDGGGVALGGAF